MSMVVKLRLSLFEDGKGPKLVTSDLTPGYKLVIGRGEGVQLWVNDKNISRAHCQMIYDDSGQLFVEDLKSRNGTFVNGQKIEEPRALNDGDEVGLASTSHLTISFIKPVEKTTSLAPEERINETLRIPKEINLVGVEFNGYHVEQLIGVGEMAVVYRAQHLSLKRFVAIKTLAPKWLENPKALKRFLNVAKVSGQLSHPNIVQIYDSGIYTLDKSNVTYKIPFLVMEHVKGESLDVILKEKRMLSVEIAAKIMGYIAGALNYTTKKKIIHRDINPSNILIGPENVPKLIGLGLAKCLEDEFNTANLTQPGKGMGMVGYIAPEQLMDASKADHRSDIYSLGAVFYHCLCGQAPYDTQNLREYFNCIHSRIPPVAPYELNSEVPRDISDLILKTLAYDPKDRYQTVDELLADLRPYLGQRPTDESFEKARKQIVAMLPSPKSIPGFEFESVYRPAEEIGGDFYDFFELNDHEFGFVIGDIAGHSIEAAVVVGMVKAAIKIIGKQVPSTAEALARVNKEIYPDLETTTYATVAYGIIDKKTKTLRFSRAGHTPLIIYNPKRNPKIKCYESQGMVLGMFSECKCQEISIQLQSGDCLIQYTDGVTEAMNPSQEEFGIERLCATIESTAPDAKKILAAVEDAVKAFTGAEKQQDDIAIVGIQVS